ncbi:MAG: rRNA maturation RNase YbeY [Alphaproteobacteria bacterium]|nr:rRNA maturation RNase YbeY [Alphaproteobacteria bacterium]MDD9919589.1 rRNA maturation RNase YbeY [Alphaproteobacteria bacterium]
MSILTCQPSIEINTCSIGTAAAAQCIKEAIEALQNTLTPIRSDGKNYGMSIRLDSDEEVKNLNAEFRYKDKPTNVLSFPTDDCDAWDDSENIMYLGDIIIADGVLTQEAHEANKPIEQHLQHLIVHGILHLYGYDHILDNEADIMENAEVHVLNKLGIPNPYQP